MGSMILTRTYRQHCSLCVRVVILSLATLTGDINPAQAQRGTSGQTGSSWAPFVQPEFPFFSSVLDAREIDSKEGENNLTPRGLILNLDHDAWVCMDLDLLRVSAVWVGEGVTPVSMSQGSYHEPGRKAPPGQDLLPEPMGDVWLVNGLFPGWQIGEQWSKHDPRERAPDPSELGLGPLPLAHARFEAVRLIEGGVMLEYRVADTLVEESWRAEARGNQVVIQRSVKLGPRTETLWAALGHALAGNDPASSQTFTMFKHSARQESLCRRVSLGDGLDLVRVAPGREPVTWTATWTKGDIPDGDEPSVWQPDKKPPSLRWEEEVVTRGGLAGESEAYVVDNIALPLENAARRNVRLADLAFFSDGRAAAVTFDGDVWMIEGLTGDLVEVRWRRFASGLHEPLSLCVREDRLYVNDRNGIWRLADEDGNGEADRHELFSNAFTQTAETREFATGMELAPDGSFVISKGGQQSSTLGIHNGCVLRVAADGRSAEVLGRGLRMPFIGVHPQTGLVTASDQQGHHVPTTPLHIIGGGQYYGFLTGLESSAEYPGKIADPLTWIPHPVNPSGASQVWLTGSGMGPLSGALLHLAYYRPEIFLVRLHDRASRWQAAVMSLTRDLAFPLLNGVVHPLDGELYVVGFQIWGTEAAQISGLARVRHTGQPAAWPREVVAMRQGILLRFDVALDEPVATDPARYSVERWEYRRTARYGSPHYRMDGSKGQETMVPSSAYLSKDRRAVVVGIPDMQPVMQMRVGWSLRTGDGLDFAASAYTTPRELAVFDPAAEGFGALKVDLTPRELAVEVGEGTPLTPAEGRRVAELMGCVACHSDDGTVLGKVGPSWKGLFGSRRPLAGGGSVVADEEYLRESIQDPGARVVRGFESSDTGMPSYEGVMTDSQLAALLEYLKSLR